MNTNNLKIAWRAAWKSKLFTTLNILGLAIGFAGFILAYAYINRENSYDAWNPNYENIYLVGLEENGKASDLTPAALAPLLEEQIPGVIAAARFSLFPYEITFHSDDDFFFIKKYAGADRSFANMFGIELVNAPIDSVIDNKLFLSKEVADKLFPNKVDFNDTWILAGNKVAGLPLQIAGTTKLTKGLSNIQFDCIGFAKDITVGRGTGINAPLYQTFIQVSPGADITQVRNKINALFKHKIAKEFETVNSSIAHSTVYLDPLKNLHLRPRHGSQTGYHIVVALGLLSVFILLLAGINFTNLMITQAQRRGKEIGLKKVFGVSRKQLAIQFLMEVMVQCFAAACIAGFLVMLMWNSMHTFFGFSSFTYSPIIFYQLSTAILVTTIIAGLYPASVLSGHRPLPILKGIFQNGDDHLKFRNALLIFQFIVAFAFLSGMLVINRQITFMKGTDTGFCTDQVVYIKNIWMYQHPKDFDLVRNRIKSVPGVTAATVATSVPGGNAPFSYDFSYMDKKHALDYIGVDFEYFETLGIECTQGRLFSSNFSADTINSAILNDAAIKAMGISQPIGAKIKGCDKDYTVVGVVKDSKTLGFEEAIKPSIYTLTSACTIPKAEIMIKISPEKTQQTLTLLAAKWSSINEKDGDHFLYEFVDQKYASLHIEQERLQKAFSIFTYLIILVALIGLFSISAYIISLREKEIGIRKILGANAQQILILLNRPFIKLILLAILVATPITWWMASKWLATFAYRIELSWWIFAVGALLTLILTFITVSYQALKAAIVNPANRLRDD